MVSFRDGNKTMTVMGPAIHPETELDKQYLIVINDPVAKKGEHFFIDKDDVVKLAQWIIATLADTE